MRRTRTYIIYALLLIGILSCRKDEPAVEEGKVIGFSIEATPTRATFFEKEDDLKNTAKQGGNFTVNAYSSGTETAYIGNQRVWYFADDDKWRFWDNATDNVFVSKKEDIISTVVIYALSFWNKSAKHFVVTFICSFLIGRIRMSKVH